MHFDHNTAYLFIAVGRGQTLDQLIEEFNFPELRRADVSYVRRLADEEAHYYQMEVRWRPNYNPDLYAILAGRIRSQPDRQGLALFGEDHELATEFLIDNWEHLV